MLRRLIYPLLLTALALAACAPAATPTPAPAAESTPAAPAPATAAASTPAPRPAVRDEFVASDPAAVNLALGRPQFVEFFAFY